MRLKIGILLLLLLPSVVAAKGFKVNKPEKFQAPSGWVEQTQLRTLKSKTYRTDPDNPKKRGAVVSTAPMHFADSFENFADINYASTLDGGYNVIDAGRFVLRYKPTGEIRFERNQGFVSFIPAFDTTDVSVEFNIHAHGLKANYYLDADSPNRLAWGFNFTSNHENEGNGKGRIRNAVSKVVAELSEFKAWDAAGMVVDLLVNYTPDSLTVLVDTVGATFPITLDPLIQDTTLQQGTTTGLQSSHATWSVARDTINATVGAAIQVGSQLVGSYFIDRIMHTFAFTGFTIGSVDSARIFIHQDAVGAPAIPPVGDSVIIAFVVGEWSGVAGTAKSDWLLFEGQQTGSAHTSTELTDNRMIMDQATASSWSSALFNSDGHNAIVAASLDTFRVAGISSDDMANTAPPHRHAARLTFDSNFAYMMLSYTEGGGPSGPASVAGITTTPASVAGLTSRSKTAGIE